MTCGLMRIFDSIDSYNSVVSKTGINYNDLFSYVLSYLYRYRVIQSNVWSRNGMAETDIFLYQTLVVLNLFTPRSFFVCVSDIAPFLFINFLSLRSPPS